MDMEVESEEFVRRASRASSSAAVGLQKPRELVPLACLALVVGEVVGCIEFRRRPVAPYMRRHGQRHLAEMLAAFKVCACVAGQTALVHQFEGGGLGGRSGRGLPFPSVERAS